MAGVLDALASYIQNMLTEMVTEEVRMLLGVSGEIDNIGIKLQDLKNFLADADRRNITDLSVQAWVRELRDAMYDATDILDLCHIKAMERGPRHDAGCFNPLLFYIRNPLQVERLTLMDDTNMETLPQYLQDVNPRLLVIDCDISLLAYIAKGESDPEWEKFSHIKQMKAYADDDRNNIKRKWFVKYTRDPFSLKKNF